MSIRKLILGVLCVALSGLALGSAPAFAASLEAPETLKPELETITETGATLRGVLNPHAPGESGGTYEFLYKASETGQCKGGSSTTPGMVLGGEAEPVAEHVEGLSRQTVYAVCLVVHNQAKTQEAIGPAVTFLTGPPETPETKQPTELAGTTARFNGILNPNSAAEEGEEYLFIFQPGDEGCQGSHEVALPEVPLPATGEAKEKVSVLAEKLLPRSKYTYCALVINKAFEIVLGQPVTFETPAASPSIVGESVVSVSSEEATVSAEISPDGLATGYSVEYEPGKTTPEVTLPASIVPVRVRQRITGLRPSTAYHYRFVARNELGAAEGASETLTTSAIAVSAGGESCANSTFAGFSPSLPDCRAYELVSGATEVGEVYDPGGTFAGHEQDTTTARPFRAAANGNGVTYVADPGLVGGDGSSAKGRGNEYLAQRSGAGWNAVNVTPPVAPVESASSERLYTSFSPDLSVGELFSGSPLTAVNPVPQGPEGCAVLYGVNDVAAPPTYSALFRETLSPGFCGRVSGPTGLDSHLTFTGESSDHSMKLFDSTAGLVSPTVNSAEVGGNVYISTAGGALTPVNILPGGAVESHAVTGGPSELPGNGPDLGGAIDASGAKVVWSATKTEKNGNGEPAAFPTALYVRTNPLSAQARTVQIDSPAEGAAGTAGAGEYWASASDGNKVFFTDCHKLTSNSTAVENAGCFHFANNTDVVKTGADLYEYEFTEGGAGKLTDLTVDKSGSDPLGADVQGVIGVSDDGSYIYFVAGGALDATSDGRREAPEPGKCEPPSTGSQESKEELEGRVPAENGCNLFELHFDGTAWEAPRFIARLSPGDNLASSSTLNAPTGSGAGDEQTGDWNPALGSRTAEVPPNGESVVFSSTQGLTGYDVSAAGLVSETASPGQSGNEIFVYKAKDNELTCASCDPRNAPPNLRVLESSFGTYLPVSASLTFMHRWINEAGTEVFFDTSQPLVPGDSNAVQDVYEWEAEETPGCPVATSVYGGCVFLLSGGASADGSFLVDADESGGNVFITHRGPLGSAGPNDDKVHLYDVRAGGGFAVSSLGCTGTGCQGVPPATPMFATPASVTFSGVGNFPPGGPVKKVTKKTIKCARGKKLSHRKCVKAKSKKKVKKVNHGKGSK